MTASDELAPEAHQHGTSRRTVIKAAGHAAWMIPAVQIASQVPAMATASDILTIANNGTYSDVAAILTKVSLKNTKVHNSSHGAAASGLKATMTATTTAGNVTFNNVSASGWTYTGETISGSGNKIHTMTFTFAGTAPAIGSDTSFEPSFNQSKLSGITISQVLFEATGFVSTTASPTKNL